jgi:hypothetical protein
MLVKTLEGRCFVSHCVFGYLIIKFKDNFPNDKDI